MSKKTADYKNIDVIAPNLNRRLSGVTSTIVRLVPIQAKKLGIVSFGVGLPDFVPRLSLKELFLLPKSNSGKSRVWHARRNVEMLLGLALKYVLRKDYKMLFTSASQRYHSWWTRFLIRRMDHVIATSNAGKAYLTVPSDVIYHGIDTDKFHPAEDKEAIKRRLSLPDAKLIGCVGRIRAQKGTDVFVDAMIKLMPRHPDWQAIILGRATISHQIFLRDLQSRVQAAGLSDRIHFVGEVETHEVVAWYQSLSLFVAPQRWEGFGLTPLEAMACGVPVVATKVGAFPELITENKTGHLIDPGDVDQMAAIVEKLLNAPDMFEKFAAASRKKMVKEFDLSVEADKLIDIYNKMINSADP